jgi:hypothetical protein
VRVRVPAQVPAQVPEQGQVPALGWGPARVRLLQVSTVLHRRSRRSHAAQR